MTHHESGAAAERVIGQATQSVFAELLAALKALLPYAVNESPGGCTGEYADTCEHCADIERARAAIAKAEGRA